MTASLGNYLLACGLALAFAVMSGLRVTVSVALVEQRGENAWSPADVGLVGSCYFYGYGATQLLGGLLGHRFSPARVLGLSVLATCLLHLLIPTLMEMFDPWTVITVRAVQGAVDGLVIPCNLGLWSRRATPESQSGLFSLTMTGISVGYIVGFPITGVLASYCGWQAPFYFYGSLGVAWCGCFFAHEFLFLRPEDEKAALREAEERGSLTETPWLRLLTRRSVWAVAVMFVANDWTISLLFSDQSQYFKDVLHMDIVVGSLLGSLPYVVWSICLALSGVLADKLIAKKVTSILNVRKLFTCGYALSAIFFIALGFVVDPTSAIAFISLGFGISGISGAGYTMNIVDVSPKYASILMGVCNTIGSFAGGLAPYTVQVLTDGRSEGKAKGWQEVMFITAGVQLVSVAVYLVMADAKPLQQWNEEEQKSESTAGKAAMVDELSTLPRFVANSSGKQHSQLTRRVSFGGGGVLKKPTEHSYQLEISS